MINTEKLITHKVRDFKGHFRPVRTCGARPYSELSLDQRSKATGQRARVDPTAERSEAGVGDITIPLLSTPPQHLRKENTFTLHYNAKC